jgi:hypothetical protein
MHKTIIEAQEFRILDSKGKIRAVLGVTDSSITGEAIGISLIDPSGQERTWMGVNTDGESVLCFYDSTDRKDNVKPRLMLISEKKGAALLIMDTDGKTLMRLRVLQEGGEILLYSPESKKPKRVITA